jgi:hypothetical protein
MAIVLVSVKGAPLTIAEFDGNFTDLDDRLTAVEDNPTEPVEIVGATISGTSLSFEMSNGSTIGPLQIPSVTQSPPAVLTETGGILTLATSHANKYVRCTNGTACAVTVPPYASVQIATGAEVHFVQAGAGTITFIEGTGVTLNYRADRVLETATQASVVSLKKVGTNEWDVIGDLAAL